MCYQNKKSSLKTGEQRQTSVTLQKSVTVPIKLENQGREKATATPLLLAKFRDYALHVSELEISESRNTNLRVWIYSEFQIP